MKAKQRRRKSTDALVKADMAKAMRAAGWTHQEIGDKMGFTRQRAQQLARAKTPEASLWRAIGPDAKDQEHFRELWWSLGMGLHDAAACIGFPVARFRPGHRTAASNGTTRQGLRTVLARRMMMGVKRRVLALAWDDGATLKDLARIFGTTRNSLPPWMNRERKMGLPLPKRPPGGIR